MRLSHSLMLPFILHGCRSLDPGKPGNLVPPTVAEDPGLPAIALEDTLLHLETRGYPENPVVIFLHGGPGNDYLSMLRLADRFDGVSLADDYFLVFWDQRGSGLSRRHDDRESLSLDQYLSDLEHLVDYFSPGRDVILLGHSWGGNMPPNT